MHLDLDGSRRHAGSRDGSTGLATRSPPMKSLAEERALVLFLASAYALIYMARSRRQCQAPSAPRRNKKPHPFSAVFSFSSGVKNSVESITHALEVAGATEVAAKPLSTDLVVATFAFGGSFKHGPGQEALHRCYSACKHLQSASLIPHGDDLHLRDYSRFMPRASSPEASAPRVLGSDGLASCITVVVTTSPMRCDPELEMLETVFASLRLVGLHACRKLLVCDNKEEEEEEPVTQAGEDAITLKRSSLPKPFMARYRERMRNLRKAPWAQDVEVVELTSWHGFALATRHALDLVSTPLVIVIQHDLAFLRGADLRPVAEALLRAPDAPSDRRVNYVVFPRPTQHGYRRELLLRTGLRVGAPVDFRGATGTVPLTRFPQFLDGTHLARCDWYRHLFRRADEEPAFGRMAARGATRRYSQEMTLGPYMLSLAKAAPQRVPCNRCDADGGGGGGGGGGGEPGDEASLGVLRVCAEFGGWLWNTEDPQGFVVFHLDASRHHAQWECDEKGLPPSEMLENYRRAAAAQARGEPVEAILPLVPQTSGKRVLAESGLCQRFAPPMRAAPADVSTRHDTVTSVTG